MRVDFKGRIIHLNDTDIRTIVEAAQEEWINFYVDLHCYTKLCNRHIAIVEHNIVDNDVCNAHQNIV